MEENKKKIKVLPVISLIVLAVALLFGTYAYWQVTRKQTNRNLLGSACLNITFSNETGDINLEHMWPTSDSDGAALTPYNFTITNTCDTAVSYIVALESLADEESQNPAYINYNYIKVKLDDGRPSTYGNSETLTNDTNEDYTIRDTKQIGINTLPGHGTKTHSLRLWLADNTPIEEMNKYFFSKVKIIAGQSIANDECYAIESDGTITEYNPECGTSATIPAVVNGIRVRNIASDAFKSRTITKTYGFSGQYSTFEDAKNAIESSSCTGVSGTQNCKLDFSLAANNKISPVFDGNAPAADATADDVFIIIYNTDTTSPQYSSIEPFARAFLASAGQELGIDTSTSQVYTINDSNLPNMSEMSEMYYSLQYSNGSWGANDPRSRSIIEYGDESLVINSLDLSQATYLERIENRAFSNVPDLNGNESLDFEKIKNCPTGLTSLTFGNNTNPIVIGGAAFANADLDSLTLYNSYKSEKIDLSSIEEAEFEKLPDKNVAYAVLSGAFGGSTIDNLTINQVGNDTKLYGIHGVDFEKEDFTGVNALGLLVVASTQPVAVQSLTLSNTFTEVYSLPYAVSTPITLPTSLTKIADFGFWLYSGPTLDIPSTVTSIGVRGFLAYNGNSLTLPSNLTNIGDGAFYNYVGTSSSLNIPGSVTTIDNDAFKSYNGPSITFNSGISKIGEHAFSDYNGANITIPNTITAIMAGAFGGLGTGTSDPKTITVNKASADFVKGTGWNGNATVVYNS